MVFVKSGISRNAASNKKNKLRKSFAALTVVLMLIFVLAACGGNNAENAENTPASAENNITANSEGIETEQNEKKAEDTDAAAKTKELASAYIEAELEGDSADIISLLHPKYVEFIVNENFDGDLYGLMEYFKSSGGARELAERGITKDDVTYELGEVTDMPEEKLSSLKKDFSEAGIGEIEDAKKVTVKITFDDDEDRERDMNEYAIKVDGSWYLMF